MEKHFIYPLIFLCYVQAQQPEVVLPLGKIWGLSQTTENGKVMEIFKGIPYAKPPVGKHRFKESIPATPWMGILNATLPPSDCLQYDHFLEGKFKVHGSEDCLYLNVYAPQLAVKTPKLDVLVYIHGGAFMFHSGTGASPERLVDNDFIGVTLNYRLGALGFLSMEDEILPGNNGLKDQLLALKWVQNNIAYFGGDPTKVTIAGMSAGGASVHYHMLSPRSRGLFSHAISLSGSALCHWAQTESSIWKTSLVAETLGCPTNDTSLLIKCLRDRPANNIVGATKLFQPYRYNPFSPFGPVVEPPSPTAFIDKPLSQIIIDKEAFDVPWLTTFTADEGLYPAAGTLLSFFQNNNFITEFLGNEILLNEIESNWQSLLPHLLDYNFTTAQKSDVTNKIWNHYVKGAIKDNKKSFVKMFSDRMFVVPISQAAMLHSKHYSSPVYSYKFNFFGEKHISDFFMTNEQYEGICHGDDLSYVMKTEFLPLSNEASIQAVSRKMVNIWISFARDLPMRPNWKPVQSAMPDYGYLEIKDGDEASDEFIIDSDPGEMKFWTSLELHEDGFIKPVHQEL